MPLLIFRPHTLLSFVSDQQQGRLTYDCKWPCISCIVYSCQIS